MAAIPIIGMFLNAASSISQGSANYDQMTKNSDALKFNAATYRVNAENILSQAAQNEATQRRRSAVQLGQARAAVAESGIGFEGTGGQLIEQSVMNAEMDALNIRYAGVLAAKGMESQAKMADYQEQVNSDSKKRLLSTMPLNVASSALSGYSSAGGKLT